MTSKDQILDEIRKLAEQLGRAPGQKLFKTHTGISHAYWQGTYWPRWSAALAEAGLEINKKIEAIAEDELHRSYLELVEDIGKVPSLAEIRFRKKSYPDFPAVVTYQKRFGSQNKIAASAYKFAVALGYEGDALNILEDAITDYDAENEDISNNREGHVYLLRSGSHFKIGQSFDLEKRVKQITIALPDKVELVHSIKTDDPPGIEAYWHRRFAEKRKNGEWFELTRDDVKAFRRRRFQ